MQLRKVVGYIAHALLSVLFQWLILGQISITGKENDLVRTEKKNFEEKTKLGEKYKKILVNLFETSKY